MLPLVAWNAIKDAVVHNLAILQPTFRNHLLLVQVDPTGLALLLTPNV